MALVVGLSLFLAFNHWIEESSSNPSLLNIDDRKLGLRAKVSKLLVYPIKSCGPIQVDSCKVTETGFEHDREWVLARKFDQGWKMVTQREYSTLVLVKPIINRSVSSNNMISLAITAPNMPKLTVERTYHHEPVPINIWETPVYGVDQGDEAAEWFSKYLDVNIRLFVKHPSFRRPFKADHSPASYLFDYTPQTGFADGFPFLILSEESVDTFVKNSFTPNEAKSVSYKNFRPNIVLKGCAPFEEEGWLHIKIGKNISFYSFLMNARCTRCEMTNIDPDIGRIPSNSTTTTLKELMKTRRVDKGAKYEACMGVNASSTSVDFEIRINDEVKVLKTATHDRRGIWNDGNMNLIKRYIE